MSKPLNLRIPKTHLETLIKFFEYPARLKEDLFNALNDYDGELVPRPLLEYLSNFVDLDKKSLFDFSDIYLAFVHSINEFSDNVDGFVESVGKSMTENFPDFNFTNENASEIHRLLSSGKSSSERAKVIKLMGENQRNFIESTIFQSLKTSFDENGNVIGSAIVHNLKLSVFEGEIKKDIFISMDKNDLEILAGQIKKAEENFENIKSTFPNAKIIDL